jgi:hypothetical protein
MAQVSRPKQEVAWNRWVYPKMPDVLEECGLETIQHYIKKRWSTIAIYVENHPILVTCQKGERKRGLQPRKWWWEQAMGLDINDATGSIE